MNWISFAIGAVVMLLIVAGVLGWYCWEVIVYFFEQRQ